MLRTLRALDTLERSAMCEHYTMENIFRSFAPLGNACLLAQLSLERAHMANIVRLARTADRHFKLLEKRVRAKVRRRCRALWRLVKLYCKLRALIWYWYELPSRHTRFEAERCRAVEAYVGFEREIAARVGEDQTQIRHVCVGSMKATQSVALAERIQVLIDDEDGEVTWAAARVSRIDADGSITVEVTEWEESDGAPYEDGPFRMNDEGTVWRRIIP